MCLVNKVVYYSKVPSTLASKSNSTLWTHWTDAKTLTFLERSKLTHQTRSTTLTTFSWCYNSSSCRSMQTLKQRLPRSAISTSHLICSSRILLKIFILSTSRGRDLRHTTRMSTTGRLLQCCHLSAVGL